MRSDTNQTFLCSADSDLIAKLLCNRKRKPALSWLRQREFGPGAKREKVIAQKVENVGSRYFDTIKKGFASS